ncbi:MULTISPECIES: glycoside hydrolase family protein [unclassified Moritella]|uniref:glycoside hydrolase family protein n=1 Tax=unclassified Moritella TaxID=2637987 RepID=UPI001BA67D78|nr:MULTISPECIES: glycoside hydrolase family protein [unclassified Moritella]QUM84170.1 glycoside hydrolase family protein [Moritella sp. 28]QUM88471.1 glycoside hydrolase family protein [Moritella sp. 36]
MNEKQYWRDELKEQLIRHEGLKLNLYQCSAGKDTIGVGRNLSDRGISEREAMYLLDNDINDIEKQVIKKCPFINDISEERKLVIFNMAFNLGVNGLLEFRMMLRALRFGHYDLAADEMLNSNWARQVGSRSLELSVMMREGGHIDFSNKKNR